MYKLAKMIAWKNIMITTFLFDAPSIGTNLVLNWTNGGGCVVGGIMILVVSTGGAGAAAAGVGIKIAAMSTGSGIAAELSGDGLVEVDVVVVVVEDEMTAVDVVVVDFAAEAGLTDMLISCLFGNSSISLWFMDNVLKILLILTSSAISVV